MANCGFGDLSVCHRQRETDTKINELADITYKRSHAMKTIAASILALGLFAGAASAANVGVFADLAETAPRSAFADIADTAPRSPFDQIRDTAPRSPFADIQATAPRAGIFGDIDRKAP
jgi:hypothetical protein